MAYYLVIFFIPYLIVNFAKISKPLENFLFFIFIIFIIFFIGFRFEMGLDWSNYIKEFYDRNYILNKDYSLFFSNLFSGKIISNRNIEPLYIFFLYLSNFFSGNIFFFNIINAIISISILYFFFVKLPNKWFALSIAISFMIFYGMDIIRQFTSLGFIFLMIYNLSKKNNIYAIIFFILSAFFHMGSIIFSTLFFYIFLKKIKVNNFYFLFSIVVFLLFYFSLSSPNHYSYVEQAYVSNGVIFRMFVNMLPLFFFLYFNKYFKTCEYYEILNWYCFFSAFIFLFFVLGYNSIVIDRFLIYILPFQILVYSFLLKSLNSKKLVSYFKFCISTFYILFGLSWMFFSEDNLRVYTPYKNILFEDFEKAPSMVCNPFNKCVLEKESKNVKFE